MFDANYLCKLWPAILALQIAIERSCRPQLISLQATMAFERARMPQRRRLRSTGRAGKEAAQRAQQVRLIVFNAQEVVPPFLRMVRMTSRVV